jgi:hypothetical protein
MLSKDILILQEMSLDISQLVTKSFTPFTEGDFVKELHTSCVVTALLHNWHHYVPCSQSEQNDIKIELDSISKDI